MTPYLNEDSPIRSISYNVFGNPHFFILNITENFFNFFWSRKGDFNLLWVFFADYPGTKSPFLDQKKIYKIFGCS